MTFRKTAHTDHYPSRINDTWTTLDRKDPIVYGTATDGPLDQHHLDRYDQQGFLVLKNYLKDWEIDKIINRSQEVRRRLDAELGESELLIREPESKAIRSIFDIHLLDEVFTQLVQSPKLADAARQILGSDVYIHQSRVNYKPGFKGKEFYWHSDFETWHVEDGMPRMRAVSCMVLLSENLPYNGPLMLVPGSHKKFVTCIGETPKEHFRHSLRKQEIGVPSADALQWLVKDGGIDMFTGGAGSVMFFECNTMHGSSGNISPYPRNNVFFVYNSMENTLVEPYCGQEPRPNYIAHRTFTPVDEL